MLFDDYYKRFILTTRNKCNYIIFYYKTILKNNIIYPMYFKKFIYWFFPVFFCELINMYNI